ncbi:MAG: hypothetical protein U1F76_06580 [Candidatus Competibacteraceae bacterium]
MATSNPWQWPALKGAEPPQQLQYERGIWGKVHGAPTDFRRIAATAKFALQHPRLERELLLGGEELPLKTQCWLSVGNTHYAVACYPSRAVDKAVRSGFLEKQIIEWRHPPEVPAALGALLLLPEVARYTDATWWDSRNRADWQEADFVLPLGDSTCPPLPVGDLELRVQHAIEVLSSAVSLEALSQFYAAVLAGQRAVALPGLSQPLPAEALGVLLLPLDRARADRFSLINWLPSRQTESKELPQRWEAILGGAAPGLALESPVPSASQWRQAERMALALSRQAPDSLIERETVSLVGEPSAAAVDQAIQLAIWGPSASGKTMLLAQLYLEIHAEKGDWDIYPTQKSLEFIDRMQEWRINNLFPPATPVGKKDQIIYEFFNHRTQVKASLLVEDRAGKDYESQEEESRQRMNTAAGLVLLVDPFREQGKLYLELSRLLNRMHVDRQEPEPKDRRPFAVCISKADFLIESPADYRRACQEPDVFVRDNDRWGLVPLLDRFCSNYRLFPVSAVGVQVRYGVIEPIAFYDENLKLRTGAQGRPFNLMAPFTWLIDQVTVNR